MKEPFNDSRGLFVPVFDNQTDETGAERLFTNALIRELQSRGNIVMSSRSEGALELKGVLTTLTVAPTTYTQPGFRGLQPFRRLPAEYGITAGISLVLIDPKTNKPLWSSGFSFFRRVEAPTDRTFDYEAPSSLGLVTQSLLEARYTDIARDIMRDVYDQMVELF